MHSCSLAIGKWCMILLYILYEVLHHILKYMKTHPHPLTVSGLYVLLAINLLEALFEFCSPL